MTDNNVTAAQRELIRSIGHLLNTSNVRTYKQSKIIHDAIWGTCEFSPWEAGLLDLPIFQRLRGLKQTGFAYLTYPAAEHSRFQHILGVTHAAAAVFDSLCKRLSADGLSPRARPNLKALSDLSDQDTAARNRILLRLAGLVHDLGHSLLSHTSERIFALINPFPALISVFLEQYDKKPGAAEVVVYLLVTSPEWYETVATVWKRASGPGTAPTPDEWLRIGLWVMGIEPTRGRKFLCDIISGPLDADKLDYIARDAYFAGIPVARDVDRFMSTVCVDRQGDDWYRISLPLNKGVNAIEQLVMSKLVLFSYLYHHQKVRAAEVAFERALAREYLSAGRVAQLANVWDLFAIQDAHLYAISGGRPGVTRCSDVQFRVLPKRVAEFREQDVTLDDPKKKAHSVNAYRKLSRLTKPKSWDDYKALLEFEDDLARRSELPVESVIVDFPDDPSYGDLESLVLPGRSPDEQTTAKEHLSYSDWIQAYNKHRVYSRVFASSNDDVALDKLWRLLVSEFAARDLRLTERLRVRK